MNRGQERLTGESFEDWKKRCFGIETLAEFKARARQHEVGVEPMTDMPEAQTDPRVGRKVTWNIYGLQFVGTVKSAYNCVFSDGQEFLSVDVETENGRPGRYPGIPASIFPPGTPDKGNAQWVD